MKSGSTLKHTVDDHVPKEMRIGRVHPVDAQRAAFLRQPKIAKLAERLGLPFVEVDDARSVQEIYYPYELRDPGVGHAQAPHRGFEVIGEREVVALVALAQ